MREVFTCSSALASHSILSPFLDWSIKKWDDGRPLSDFVRTLPQYGVIDTAPIQLVNQYPTTSP